MILEQEPSRVILREALEKSYGLETAGAIMSDPRAYNNTQIEPGPIWLNLEGCWMFKKWGMAIAVERDGYVHS